MNINEIRQGVELRNVPKSEQNGITKKRITPQVQFSIKDTELILRVMLESDFKGKDIERVAETMTKVRELHEKLLNQAMDIIS